MKIAIGADHGGYELKELIKKLLLEKGHEVHDLGCKDKCAVHYPVVGTSVIKKVLSGECDRAVLVCGTGIGMSILANRFKGIRATLCHDTYTARMSREHNDSNVLCLGGRIIGAAIAEEIVNTWLETPFASGRHLSRLSMIDEEVSEVVASLNKVDPEVYQAIRAELVRQSTQLEMIASENFASIAVMEAEGSVFMNKYAEGYPGKRYYGGCEYMDVVERLAVERLNVLFGAEYANVQPHSGSQANMGVYFASIQPGDTILSMNLAHGGHLSHGSKVNFSGRLYNVVHYGVNKDTETIDMDEVMQLAKQHKPRIIVVGASAYPRTIDFAAFRMVADEVGAYVMADIAHIAGLVASGIHPSPVPFAEFVTSTTHKTLRGPRGGLILSTEKFAKLLDSQIFPGIQGGPLMHVIAAKAVAFKEALGDEFKFYQQRIVANAKVLAKTLQDAGFRLVSGGTDNHLMLLDLTEKGITGAEAEQWLEKAGITVNKNAIPYDKQPPRVTSGIRIGTPALTTRGFREAEMKEVGGFIAAVIESRGKDAVTRQVRLKIRDMCEKLPLYPELQ